MALMDIIANLFSTLWTALNNESLVIPIVNMTVGRFIVAIFVVNVVTGLLMMFLGKAVTSDGAHAKNVLRS